MLIFPTRILVGNAGYEHRECVAVPMVSLNRMRDMTIHMVVQHEALVVDCNIRLPGLRRYYTWSHHQDGNGRGGWRNILMME